MPPTRSPIQEFPVPLEGRAKCLAGEALVCPTECIQAILGKRRHGCCSGASGHPQVPWRTSEKVDEDLMHSEDS